MDAIRRNKQINSLKFLISKCEEGNSIISAVGSGEESKLSGEVGSSMDSTGNASGRPAYHDQLLNELASYAELRSCLHDATLSWDTSLLTDTDTDVDTDQCLPNGATLAELVGELDRLGDRLASIGESMEPLGWRLLQNTFTGGLDLPYEQHGNVKSLLGEMSILIRNLNTLELAFQKAASYKPSKKLGDDLTGAVRDLCDLRARLDTIRALRHNCRVVDSSDLSCTAPAAAGAALGGGTSELQDSVFCYNSGS